MNIRPPPNYRSGGATVVILVKSFQNVLSNHAYMYCIYYTISLLDTSHAGIQFA